MRRWSGPERLCAISACHKAKTHESPHPSISASVYPLAVTIAVLPLYAAWGDVQEAEHMTHASGQSGEEWDKWKH